MTCILADLPDEDIKRLAAEQGKSRAAVLSLTLRWYRQQTESDT
ncbi:MAG: hypothetical protein ABL918_05665 [Chakrabartia sp.]